MTITYKDSVVGVKVPVLHKVVYDQKKQYGDRYYEVYEWLKENSKNPYYHSPSWTDEQFIHFECSEDAVAFRLRWG